VVEAVLFADHELLSARVTLACTHGAHAVLGFESRVVADVTSLVGDIRGLECFASCEESII